MQPTQEKPEHSIPRWPVILVAVVAGIFLVAFWVARHSAPAGATNESPLRTPPTEERAEEVVPQEPLPAFTRVEVSGPDPDVIEMTSHASQRVALRDPLADDVTEESLGRLLDHLRHEAETLALGVRTPPPTSYWLEVRIYADEARARSDASPMARLFRTLGGTTSIFTDAEQLVAIREPPQERFGLSEERRQFVYRQREDAVCLATKQILDPPNHDLQPGDELSLTVAVSLMREHPDDYDRLDLSEQIAALQWTRDLLPGMKIEVVLCREIAGSSTGDSWYFVDVHDPTGRLLARGWVNPVALDMNSTIEGHSPAEYSKEQIRVSDETMDVYFAAIAASEGITVEQLDEIGSEGARKGWPCWWD